MLRDNTRAMDAAIRETWAAAFGRGPWSEGLDCAASGSIPACHSVSYHAGLNEPCWLWIEQVTPAKLGPVVLCAPGFKREIKTVEQARAAAADAIATAWPVYLVESGDYCPCRTDQGYIVGYLTPAEHREYDGPRLGYSVNPAGGATDGYHVHRPGPDGPQFMPAYPKRPIPQTVKAIRAAVKRKDISALRAASGQLASDLCGAPALMPRWSVYEDLGRYAARLNQAIQGPRWLTWADYEARQFSGWLDYLLAACKEYAN